MNDRLRILEATRRWSGVFTASELAAQTGVNLATVRTVLSRDRCFFEAQGRTEPVGRGGRTIKLAVKETERAALDRELDRVREEFGFLSGQRSSTTADHSEYLESPLALVAAEDALDREIEDCADVLERSRILARARRDLKAALNLLKEAHDGSAPFRRFYSDIALLEGLADAHELHDNVTAPNTWLNLFRALIFKIRPAAGALAGSRDRDATQAVTRPFVPVSEASDSVQPDYGAMFNEIQQWIQARYNKEDNQRLPPIALLEAAERFSNQLITRVPLTLTVDDVATPICEKVNPEFPMDALVFLGCEPAAYQKDVVHTDEKTIVVKSMNFNRAYSEIGRPKTPIGSRMMAVAR